VSGSPLPWVASFAEEHWSIYASWDHDLLRLYFQSDGAKVVLRADLEADARRSWAAELGCDR
jgi:hypothetical protein